MVASQTNIPGAVLHALRRVLRSRHRPALQRHRGRNRARLQVDNAHHHDCLHGHRQPPLPLHSHRLLQVSQLQHPAA